MELSEAELERVDEVLATARSVRRKLDFERPIPRRVLMDCIDVATQAPTGAAGESWRFVVVDEPAPKAALSRLYGAVLEEFAAARGIEIKPTQRALVDRLHEIPAMIFVCVDAPPPGHEIPMQVAYYGSIMPAAWSLMLALRARSIGSTWTSLLSARQAEVAEVLGMPADTLQTVMLPAGYMKGAKLRRAARAPAAEVTFFNAWNRRT